MGTESISRRSFLVSASITGIGVGYMAFAAEADGDAAASEEARRERYKNTSQRDLFMNVYFPGDWSAADRRPAIVFFFGGGWQQGNPAQFAYQSESLARRGMVAACADYRVKGKDGTGPETCVEDAQSAVRWLRANHERLGIDPERIVAGGGSAGGHLAACTALTPDIVGENEDATVSSKTCAMVLFNPVLNLMGEPRLMERVGGDEATARLISPTLHLASGSPPAILFYGRQDRLLSQGEEFVARSKELGVQAELHVTSGQNHGFFNKPPYRDETLKRADEFLVSLGMLTGESKRTRANNT